MKRLNWGRNAVQAAAIVDTGIAGEYEYHKRQFPRRKSGSNGQHQKPPPLSRIPKSRSSVELHLESRKCLDFDFITDDWVDCIPPPQYSQIPAPTVGDIPKFNIKHVPASPPPPNTCESDASIQPPGFLRDASLASENSPALQSLLYSDPPKTMRAVRRKESCSSTSTLFERSPTVPITIVVTTPDQELPSQSDPSPMAAGSNSAPALRKFRNDSTMSLPSISSNSLAARQIPDRTRLMPPTAPQVDARRFRKAREFEEIRRFLIGFLNAKGAQFPRNFRMRIMSIYGISDADLDPRIVAKFDLENGEVQDEGVVLEHGLHGGGPSDREHLRILEMAFQSLIPVVTPQPHPAHDILAARRKRISKPLRSPSLHTLEPPVQGANRMSLSANNKSKTTLDSIINNKSVLRSRRVSTSPTKSSTATIPPSKSSPKSRPIIIQPHHKILESSPPLRIESCIQPSPPSPQKPIPQPPPKVYQPRGSPASIPKYDEHDPYFPPAWMAPLISISSADPPPFQPNSDHEVKGPQNTQAGTMFPSHPAFSPLSGHREDGGNWLRLDEKQARIVELTKRGKKSTALSNAFTTMKLNFGASKAAKEKKRNTLR